MSATGVVILNVNVKVVDDVVQLEVETPLGSTTLQTGVTEVMKKNLQDLLKREENLENLMAKSNDLSKVSVEFYKKAKESNRKGSCPF